MPVMRNTELRQPGETGRARKLRGDVANTLSHLRIVEKIYSIAGFLALVMTLMVVMAIQSVRLQTEYRRALATSATATINVERVNALIYAIVMESRGIYMSTDPARVKHFAGELLRRDRELADVVNGWEKIVDFRDEAQFPAFKKRIVQFIDFRHELARRGTEISPAAAREWGDTNTNRNLRMELNGDLEGFAKILGTRAALAADLGDRAQMAAWYLALLGLSGLLLTALNALVVRRSIITPLSDIAEATDSIAAGNIDIAIPHIARQDEIGYLAQAVQKFREAVGRNFELQQLELGTARQRDEAMGERDRLNDKYHRSRRQLGAALANMAQGLVMIDANEKILLTNERFRTMYQLPPEIVGPDTTLQGIMTYRARKGLFLGNVEEAMAEIRVRIATGKPSTTERDLGDGRVVRISEQPMTGGGWVATHEDFTEQRRSQRILERTEQFLATIIENVPEAIVAKDARDLRYVFVNRAAEKMIGVPRAEIIGKTARELFPAEMAALIERRDRQLLAQQQQLEPIVDTMDSPITGRRTVAVRRLQVGGPDRESHLFVSMVEDRTDQVNVAGIAA
jgi:PAS domain S-box-containing protein